jgi:hypothetical protein
VLAGCEEEKIHEKIHPATLQNIPGTELNRVILTKDAIKKIDLQVVPIQELLVQGKNFKVIPYSAVIYGPNGQAWVYTEINDRTFVRAPIQIEEVAENNVLFTNGPNINTKIVTVGVSELYGAEYLGNIEP